ncbi:MAG: AMP-dependent synthetase [Xanthobacteraceae bacterium]|nr:MAG: AMP-dependent synthetase [Xanthobacteraceae bacterium]
MSIVARLSGHAARQPDKAAIILDGTALSWRDLHAQVERLAAHFAALTPPGGGIALHLANGPALALAFLAAARAGREAQVLDAGWPRAIVEAVVAGLGSALVVTTDARLAAPDRILIDDRGLDPRAVADAFAAPANPPAPPQPDTLQPFYVGLTSGSTGLPKAYRRHHRSWLDSFAADAVEFGVTADDVVLAPGALSHSLFLYALAHGIHVGATVILCRAFRPLTALELARRHDATIIYGVPTQLQMLVEAAERAGLAPLVAPRWVLSTGAKWFAPTDRLRRLFPACGFAEFYGASETSFITVAKDGEPVPEDSVGRAFHGVRLSIRDEAGRELPSGEAGLVYVDSPMLFSAYALGGGDQPPRIGNAMTVGDVGFLDVGGYLHLVGRARRMIVTSGKNLYPEEIEAVLERHASVAHAAVFALADAKRGERLVAVIAPRGTVRIERAALIAHARVALPLYKVPRIFGILRDWPLTRSGKTDFEAVRALWDEGRCESLQ